MRRGCILLPQGHKHIATDKVKAQVCSPFALGYFSNPRVESMREGRIYARGWNLCARVESVRESISCLF